MNKNEVNISLFALVTLGTACFCRLFVPNQETVTNPLPTYVCASGNSSALVASHSSDLVLPLNAVSKVCGNAIVGTRSEARPQNSRSATYSVRPLSISSQASVVSVGGKGQVLGAVSMAPTPVAEAPLLLPLPMPQKHTLARMTSPQTGPVKRFKPPTTGSAFGNWMASGQAESAYLYTGEDGVQYYDMSLLYNLFLSQYGSSDEPSLSWEEFLQWFNDEKQTQYAAPLSNTCPCLLLLAVVYGLSIYHKTKKQCI